MSNRWLRFVIAVLALAAAGAAGFKIFEQEQRFATNATVLGAAARAAESAATTTTEIKAALHAYVAAGQGQAFWSNRAKALLDTLRVAVLELDGLGGAMGADGTDALDLSDRLAASEQRARDYVQAGQQLLASDVIFTDSRDLVDGLRVQISRARDGIVSHVEAQQSEIRREQATLALAAGGILALGVLILVPTGRSTDPEADLSAVGTHTQPARVPPVAAPEPVASASARANSGELRRDLAEAAGREGGPAAPPAEPAASAALASASAGANSGELRRDLAEAASGREGGPAAPIAPDLTPVPLAATASLCTDLARVSDGSEISGFMRRTCDVLGASGIILWIASPDRRMLFPVASAGYDERLVNRIGPITRDESNLTATAFREAASRTSGSSDMSRAALAVPLLTPEGPVGVFSAELHGGDSLKPQQVDLATIVAAQLSMIVGALAVETIAAPAHQAQA